MSIEVLLALFGFIFIAAITPGPNNIMLLASGVNYGFRRTIPHMMGVIIGFPAMALCIGYGLGEILERVPLLFDLIKIAGGTYLLYLAYKIATSGPVESRTGRAKPLSFMQAAAFQWVNPKSWVVGISAMAAFSDVTNFHTSVWIITFVFALGAVFSVVMWTGFGTVLRSFMSNPKYFKAFNFTMAALLVLSLWPMLR